MSPALPLRTCLRAQTLALSPVLSPPDRTEPRLRGLPVKSARVLAKQSPHCAHARVASLPEGCKLAGLETTAAGWPLHPPPAGRQPQAASEQHPGDIHQPRSQGWCQLSRTHSLAFLRGKRLLIRYLDDHCDVVLLRIRHHLTAPISFSTRVSVRGNGPCFFIRPEPRPVSLSLFDHSLQKYRTLQGQDGPEGQGQGDGRAAHASTGPRPRHLRPESTTE